MDLQTIGLDLFKISPLLGLLALSVYVLWTNLQKAQQSLMDTMKAHADDRKDSQEKMSSVVSQNSLTNLQLAGSVDNLSKAVTDNTTKLSSLEGTVKSNRVIRTNPASKQPTA